MREPRAHIIEVFASLQGEGPYAGERHLFVRFQDCSLSCRFCDTPASFIQNPTCRVERQPFTKKFDVIPNPLAISELNNIIAGFAGMKTIAVTGGEPLESGDFIRAWLPTLEGSYRILLETAGIHYQELMEVLPYVDVISMDIKLPSVTGMRAYWPEHREFLARAGDKELYVKVVVSAETMETDIDRAIELVAVRSDPIPFIIQPATPFAQFRAEPSTVQLNDWRRRAQARLGDVRVIPQLHKRLRLL